MTLRPTVLPGFADCRPASTSCGGTTRGTLAGVVGLGELLALCAEVSAWLAGPVRRSAPVMAQDVSRKALIGKRRVAYG